jgi:hypothetical protein
MSKLQLTTALCLALAVVACADRREGTKLDDQASTDEHDGDTIILTPELDASQMRVTRDATIDDMLDAAMVDDPAADDAAMDDAVMDDAAMDDATVDEVVLDGAFEADSSVDAAPPSWKVGELSVCSTTCGGGMQTRTVECVSEDGAALDDAMCEEPKPAATQACIASAGCSWRTGAFGVCSSVCGTGTQTRDVHCAGPDGITVDDALCSAARPASSQTCVSTASCRWWTSTWGACSVNCGTGLQTRMVACVDPLGQVVSGSYCTAAMPNGTQACSRPACRVYVVGEPTAANGPCYRPGCIGPTPSYPACPAGYVSVREETACGNPSACNGNWALCTFRDVAGYGCNGADYSMPVAVRECQYQQ